MSGKDSKALFACSKCFARYPFEELSQGQQLCKVKVENDVVCEIFIYLFMNRNVAAISQS